MPSAMSPAAMLPVPPPDPTFPSPSRSTRRVLMDRISTSPPPTVVGPVHNQAGQGLILFTLGLLAEQFAQIDKGAVVGE